MPPVPPSNEDLIYTLADGEDTRVVLHRFGRMLELGVDPLEASALAEIQDVEHKIRDLLVRGCELKTAVAIVL